MKIVETLKHSDNDENDFVNIISLYFPHTHAISIPFISVEEIRENEDKHCIIR